MAPIYATPERGLLDMVGGIWGCRELVPVLEHPLGRVDGLQWYNDVPLWYHCARLQPLSKNLWPRPAAPRPGRGVRQRTTVLTQAGICMLRPRRPSSSGCCIPPRSPEVPPHNIQRRAVSCGRQPGYAARGSRGMKLRRPNCPIARCAFVFCVRRISRTPDRSCAVLAGRLQRERLHPQLRLHRSCE